MRRCQSVRGYAWYMGGKTKHRQRGGMFPFEALAVTISGTLGGVVAKKLFGSRRRQKHIYV